MIKIEDLKIGQEVYYVRYPLDEPVEYGKVEKFRKARDLDGSLYDYPYIDWESFVDENGNVIRDSYGNSGVQSERLFDNPKDAYKYIEDYKAKHRKNLESEITDVKSLLLFPLKNSFDSEYSSCWIEKDVYIKKAKELLGIDLEKDK